jgi:hypothetical protein
MTTFTDDELKVIGKAPMMTGIAIAMVDLGIVSAAIEAVAMTKEFVSAAKKYPSNSIIQAIFSEEAVKSGSMKMEKPDIKPEDVTSGALLDMAIADINNAISTIESKATAEEVKEYKEFIYSCADTVANAAGTGLFGSGTKVTDKEKVALAKLKTALGI